MAAQFTLPELGYEMSALEPVISEETMKFHYGKHFKAYIDQLNILAEGTEYENMSLVELIQEIPEGAFFNNAGQVLNHALYFEQFTPVSAGFENIPDEKLDRAIYEAFGNFETFKERMIEAAVKLFGSGWAWLVQTENGSLKIEQYANADNPVRHKLQPLMCIDVWEHAYYLDFKNARAEYVKKIWSLINWEIVSKRMK